jgi:hypothetical protein
VLTDGRLALYAKGRIRGKWLMTLAYDSDKKEDETRFGGVIDPTLITPSMPTAASGATTPPRCASSI